MQTTCETPTNFSIKDVSSLTNIPQTTLREWERFFSIPIKRNELGQRQYREISINLFKEIKKLKAEGLRLEDIKTRIDIDTKTYDTSTPKIEFFETPMPEDLEKQVENGYELVIKTHQDRIKQLERFEFKALELAELKGKLEERCQQQEKIIEDKGNLVTVYQTRVKELEERLNKRWWQRFFKD